MGGDFAQMYFFEIEQFFVDLKCKIFSDKKQHKKSRYPLEPLFDDSDVEQTLPLVQPVLFNKTHPLGEGVNVTFHAAGHILGSAMLEFFVDEEGQRRRVVFSGDIGQCDKPIIRDPSFLEEADYLVLESTYGDRLQPRSDIFSQFADVITKTVNRGGVLVIPAFAVGRVHLEGDGFLRIEFFEPEIALAQKAGAEAMAGFAEVVENEGAVGLGEDGDALAAFVVEGGDHGTGDGVAGVGFG